MSALDKAIDLLQGLGSEGKSNDALVKIILGLFKDHPRYQELLNTRSYHVHSADTIKIYIEMGYDDNATGNWLLFDAINHGFVETMRVILRPPNKIPFNSHLIEGGMWNRLSGTLQGCLQLSTAGRSYPKENIAGILELARWMELPAPIAELLKRVEEARKGVPEVSYDTSKLFGFIDILDEKSAIAELETIELTFSEKSKAGLLASNRGMRNLTKKIFAKNPDPQ